LVYAAENRALVASQVARVMLEKPNTDQKFHSLCRTVRDAEAVDCETKPYFEHLILACSLQGRLV
jgi:hypothetical protein